MRDRALGNPLGNPLGLPKAGGFQPKATTYTRIVSGAGVLIPPEGAKLMRVAVIGGGARGYARAVYSTLYGTTTRYAGGGSGGGCAASSIIQAAEIAYSIGEGGNAGNLGHGGDTTATIGAHFLIGEGAQRGFNSIKGGYSGSSILQIGYSGGQGGSNSQTTGSSVAGGGGGAGPMGDGGIGAAGYYTSGDVYTTEASDGQLALIGWGVGGGAGASFTREIAQGGGGAGASAGTTAFGAKPVITLKGGMPWGEPSPHNEYSTALKAGAGGLLGGGGGALAESTSGTIEGNGGAGGLVVEWFY